MLITDCVFFFFFCIGTQADLHHMLWRGGCGVMGEGGGGGGEGVLKQIKRDKKKIAVFVFLLLSQVPGGGLSFIQI